MNCKKAPRLTALMVVAGLALLGLPALGDDASGGPDAQLTPSCVIRHTALGWQVKTFDGIQSSATDPRPGWEARYQADIRHKVPVLMQLDSETWVPVTMIHDAMSSTGATAFRTDFGILTGDAASFGRYAQAKERLEKAMEPAPVPAPAGAAGRARSHPV